MRNKLTFAVCSVIPCLGSAAVAQGLACSAAGASAFRQSAMATLPPQQTSPAAWGVNDIPAMQDVPANPDLSAPSDTMIPAGGGTSANNTALQPAGTGGLMIPNTPSSSGGLGGTSIAPTPGATFEDNFASGIDTSKWGFNYPWGKIAGDATQYAGYVDGTAGNNVFSTGSGGLGISVLPTGLDGKPAETGQLHSTQSFQYGYFEMTATLPTTKGVGSAFWLMPTDGSGTYSELDVMESLGQDPSTIYSTIHDGGGQQQYAATVAGGVQSPHTYGVDWQPNKTTFYVDGKATGSEPTPASMQKPMYMILSNNSTPASSPSPWGQAVDGSTQLPATFDVQNVRVLAKAPY